MQSFVIQSKSHNYFCLRGGAKAANKIRKDRKNRCSRQIKDVDKEKQMAGTNILVLTRELLKA